MLKDSEKHCMRAELVLRGEFWMYNFPTYSTGKRVVRGRAVHYGGCEGEMWLRRLVGGGAVVGVSAA